MDRRWLALIAIPLGLATAVLIIAPPVPLSTDEDRAKARRMEEQKFKPEPIPIPPEVAKSSARDPVNRPALPRTSAELSQLRALLKAREETLLQRKAKLPPYDEANRSALYIDIVIYNEDLSAYEAAAANIAK